MSELQHADLLAQWLANAPGTEPPDGLDDEVLAAVYALAPNRAPAHRVSVTAVLDTLVSGPLADPEIAQAAIALNPDLAPAHRVGIDDILDSVTTGPFAQPQDTVIDLAARRRRRNRWAGIGALAAAAVALFVVIPIQDKADHAPHAEAVPVKLTASAGEGKVKQEEGIATRKAPKQRRAMPAAQPETDRNAAQRAPRKESAQVDRAVADEALQSVTLSSQSPAQTSRDNTAELEPEDEAEPVFPPGMGARGSRAASAKMRPQPALGTVDAAPAAAAIQADEDGTLGGQLAQVTGSQGRSARSAAPPSPPAAEASAEARRKPSGLSSRGSEGGGMGLGGPVPKGTWDGFPDTQRFVAEVMAATRIEEKNPSRALAKLRRALKRYKKVHPQQRALAHAREARILKRLGRHDEATEAKKKARDIESAN